MLTAGARWTRIAKLIAANWRTRLRAALGNRAGVTGLTHTIQNNAETSAYIQRVVDDYVRYGELTDERIRDAAILEIGPGDNLGVAQRFLAMGARRVVCLDKFQYDDASRDGATSDPARLRSVCAGLEDAGHALAGEQFDVIVSRAVLHEIFDIDRAFTVMDRLLAPGGRMIHKVDLRDYGMFTSLDGHPREFLTVPAPIYTQMVKGSARPNRRMIDYYRRKMSELGYDARLYIALIVQRHNPPGVHQPEILPHKLKLESGVDYTEADVAMIAEIRPRLAPPFRALSDEDLLAGSFMMLAVKPAAAASSGI